MQRRPVPSVARPNPVGLSLPLGAVLDGSRPGASEPDLDLVWRELRVVLFRSECGGRFDPRHVLPRERAAQAGWREARRAWAARLFADDSRVRLED